MEKLKNSKKWIGSKAFHEDKGVIDYTELITTNTAYKSQCYIHTEYNASLGKHNKNLPKKTAFKTWSFGIINIRSTKEKDEDGKTYLITKELANTGLRLYCLQEVKYRNSVASSENYEFYR